MCWLTPKQCRRTKSVCDKPECLAPWRQNETRLQREACTIYQNLVAGLRDQVPPKPSGGTVH